MLAAYAAMVTDIGARIAPVYAALQGAAQTDPEAASNGRIRRMLVIKAAGG